MTTNIMLKTMSIQILLIFIIGGLCQVVNGQQPVSKLVEEILLYPIAKEVVPEEHIRDGGGNLIISKVTNPSLMTFIPSSENKDKAAVIICPGGGYSNLHIQREGFKIAEAFNQEGIAAFVLKYRLPSENGTLAPLKDAQRTIQLIRENAKKWGIAPDKIGIMGFSAGGHLASTAGVHYDSAYIENESNMSLRPDFMILIYPVISFSDNIGHAGSINNLLGGYPDEKKVTFFSNELHVTNNTPTCILFHANDDSLVPVENSLHFYDSLRKHDVSAELHIYSKGEHGFLEIPEFKKWFDTCIQWMETEHITSSK